MNQLLNQTFRMVSRILGWLFEKGWAEPVAIKGWIWTVALYLAIGCAAAIARAGQVAPLALGLGALWVMKRESRPKRLGRELPYRRRR